ncbi:MAG: TonB-dependent receptor domain-containing protein [Myxococcota bacterium]
MRRFWTVGASLLVATLASAQEFSKTPQLLTEVPASFPAAALRDRVAADVQFELTVEADGSVSDVVLVETSTRAEAQPDGRLLTETSTITDYGFAAAGRAALTKFKFSPAEIDDQPVPVRLTYTFRFKLPPAPPPPPAAGTEVRTATQAESVVNFRGVVRERGTRRRISGAIVTVFRLESDARSDTSASTLEEPRAPQETGSEALEDDPAVTGFEAVTDDEGAFEFYDLRSGAWKVLVEKDGFYPYRTTENVSLVEVIDATYYIEAGTYNPYDVTVTAERDFKEVTRRSLTPTQAELIPGTFGDPISSIQNLPGVSRAPAGVGALPVRGSAPGDTGILFEGIETPFIFHFGALRSVVPGEFIESVEFIPGNFSAYYGRRTGGILDVQLKDLNPDQIHGKVSLGVLEGQLFLEAPITETLAVAGGVRRSWIDLLVEAAAPDDGSVDIIAAPVYTDYQTLVNWRPGRAHELKFFFFGSRDRLELISRDAQEANVQLTSGSVELGVGFDRIIAQYNYRPSQRFTNELQLGFGLDQIATEAFDFLEFDLDNLVWQVRDRVRMKPLDWLSIDVGVDGLFRLSDVNVVVPSPDQDPLNPDLTDLVTTSLDDDFDAQIAPYVETTIDITERLTVVPGLRLDYFADANELVIDPRIVARYAFDDQWAVKAGVGRFSQPPAPQSINETVGNPEIVAFHSLQVSAGVSYQPFPYLTADLTLFYKDIDDVIGASDGFRVNPEGDTVPEILDNNTTGEVIGLEFFLNHQFNRNFQGFLGYTLSRATRTEEDGSTDLFDFDQTHILVVAFSYLLPQNWQFGLRWRFISGSPFTEIIGGVFLEDTDEYGPIFGPENDQRLPIFHQLDVRLDKKWVYRSFTVGAFLEVLNTYNRSNAEGFNYNFDFSEREEISSLPIIPNLGVEVTF